MRLSFAQYKDKVMGCWTGKNIGGVLGAPFEGKRQKVQIDNYQQDLSAGPPPNDDLDLQIVWLSAVEKYGRNVNAQILGEYWLSYVIPNWVEYGMGKANLRAGIVPPMSGVVDNVYKDSCGCFIRSEIWACLAPGHPEIAARYAYEDGIVDHGDEGVRGEIFFAALESAAFVESCPDTLLDIALSYIPDDCAVARAVQEARTCYREGVDFWEARKRVHNLVPGTFGIQSCKISEIDPEEKDLELGAPGFDAPENIAFAILGWLYGEGDFGKALCLAVGCGEDTDCSGASLGALLGILCGASQIPEKWTKPLNDKIATLCIDKTSRGVWVPDTVTQLADRLMRITPLFLGVSGCDLFAPGGYEILYQTDALFCPAKEEYLPFINGGGKSKEIPVRFLSGQSSHVVHYEALAFQVLVDYGEDSVFFEGQTPKVIRVTVMDTGLLCQQQWVRLKLYTPDHVIVEEGRTRLLPLNNLYQSKAETSFTLRTDEYDAPKLECILDVSLEARHSSLPIKITLMRRA